MALGAVCVLSAAERARPFVCGRTAGGRSVVPAVGGQPAANSGSGLGSSVGCVGG